MTTDITPAAPDESALYQSVRDILDGAKTRAARSINVEMTRAYWLIGQAIVEHEQGGQQRADYGTQLLQSLSKRLSADGLKGFNLTNLKYMRQFFLLFPIGHSLSDQLSWTHYRHLLRVEKSAAREWYEREAIASAWSTRELERQISSLFYERVLMSGEKAAMLQTQGEGSEKYRPQDFIKDPFVLEFLDLKDAPHLSEHDLESALLDHIQEFLLELGESFSFVARQKRLTLDGDHFYIDLVFYNRLLRCFVLVDLKMGKLTHQDLGQMQLYVNFYSREKREEWENPAIGLLLCADKNETVVRYTLPENQSQIFAARHQLELPTEEQLRLELERETAKLRSLQSPPS